MATMQMKKVVGGAVEQLVNYDYVDIADGTGYITFYGGYLARGSEVSGAKLSPYKWYSDLVLSANESYTCSGSAFTKAQDLDFDVTFNIPRTVKGQMMVNIPVGIKEVTDSSYTAYNWAKVYRVTGGVETLLGSASGSRLVQTTGGIGTYKYNMDAIKVDLSGGHVFGVDDTLRVTVEQWVRDSAGATGQASFAIGTDPMNRATNPSASFTFGAAPTIFQVQVPFKIET